MEKEFIFGLMEINMKVINNLELVISKKKYYRNNDNINN